MAGAYLRPHRGSVGLALLMMALDAAGTGALAWLMEPMINDIFTEQRADRLWPVAGMVFGAFLLRGFAGYFHAVLINNVGQHIVARVQTDLFGHLMRADLAYFHANPAGQLISRLVSDVTLMRQAVAESLTGIGKSVLTLIFLVGVMFYQDWLLSIISFTVFPLTAVVLARIGRRLRRVSARTQGELGTFSSLLNQAFQGARHVKAYGMEAHEEARVGGLIASLLHLTRKGFRVSAMLTPINEVLSGIAIVTVILYGGSKVISGADTAGSLLSFITAFMLAYEPMKKLSKLNAQLQIGLASAERVYQVLDHAAEIRDRPGAAPLKVASHEIRFDDVHFSYVDGKEALAGVSIEVPAGRTVALVGTSGSGKSTVLNLIPRFYDVDAGRVSIGGVDVRDATLSSLRSAIGLVSQDAGLFDDSIRANIAYGRPGATEAEIEAAARDAAAHDFIVGLPEGYDTRVGENGVKLSGGQRQRIAIARAMLKNAPILLLDEATSALDSESERAVQEALRRLQRGRTTVVVAHRLSTIVDADRIYVFEEGRVVESGSHAELLRAAGPYSRFHALQAAGAEP
ncbi:MAG TPA: ABC transporter ATP-binding protein [Azospirillaceae bacterium]|nr:ABC transporter ATP-binding protein [Azospirillaceae bacterium]